MFHIFSGSRRRAGFKVRSSTNKSPGMRMRLTRGICTHPSWFSSRNEPTTLQTTSVQVGFDVERRFTHFSKPQRIIAPDQLSMSSRTIRQSMLRTIKDGFRAVTSSSARRTSPSLMNRSGATPEGPHQTREFMMLLLIIACTSLVG